MKVDTEELSLAVGVRIVKIAELLELEPNNRIHQNLVVAMTRNLMICVINELNSGRAKSIEEALSPAYVQSKYAKKVR